MDFSQPPYFSGAQPYHHFIGIAPLAQSHANSAPADNFRNQSPPVDSYDGAYPPPTQQGEAFQAYEPYAAFPHGNAPQHHAYPGPPGPPTPPTPHHPFAQGHLDGHLHDVHGQMAGVESHQQAVFAHMAKADADATGRGASNSEDDDLTPAQSRRKAQNRAAQRAFRERKEQHVKNLEQKLAALEASQAQTAKENDRLKKDLQRVTTENEVLRATSTAGTGSRSPAASSPSAEVTIGPQQYNPTDFYSDLLANHANKTPSHRVTRSTAGERLLAAGATWDLITNHHDFKRGLIDVGDVSERLKPLAKCDGQGPVFEEKAVLRAIADSVASGSDELL